jgi:hypothetical protein
MILNEKIINCKVVDLVKYYNFNVDRLHSTLLINSNLIQ